MAYKSDIEIAQAAEMSDIVDIAKKLDISEDDIELYGKYKAKINDSNYVDNKKGKLILVTAINPTPAGEGKTTTSVGLGDALTMIGKKTAIALREPSLGPVFGVKGGAAGGGYAQVVPMEDINLHFTGDLHAIGAANNLLAAMIDNHIFHGNKLGIDPRQITWNRCVDMNDRQLRYITDGLNGRTNGMPREDSFDITVASEVMAVLCLAENIEDLKQRLKRIVIGYTFDRMPVTAGDINAHGAMTALLKDAVKPNLVQTLEHTPVFIHGGPFANIAHGCNSVRATKLALSTADYVVTEAGFGADLGAEKFLDIKCRIADIKPDVVVIVATIRALKHHGGAAKDELGKEDLDKLSKGFTNLVGHIDNIKNQYKLPCVVAINKFPTDTDAEVDLIIKECKNIGVKVALSDVWALGGEGGIDLANICVDEIENGENNFTFAYNDDDSIKDKIRKVVKNIYGGADVKFVAPTNTQIKRIEKFGYGNLPVCIAKTQYSFSDNPKLLGRPSDFTVTVSEVKISAGAGFIVVKTGAIMTMPGLPKVPSAELIDVDENGKITGLF